MKKLLIATTALVATAGMASADITISGHAAAGIYSGLGNADGVAKNVTGTKSKSFKSIAIATGIITEHADAAVVNLASGSFLFSFYFCLIQTMKYQ